MHKTYEAAQLRHIHLIVSSNRSFDEHKRFKKKHL